MAVPLLVVLVLLIMLAPACESGNLHQPDCNFCEAAEDWTRQLKTLINFSFTKINLLVDENNDIC